MKVINQTFQKWLRSIISERMKHESERENIFRKWCNTWINISKVFKALKENCKLWDFEIVSFKYLENH
jgi:REP element-mobilizing transposase RayT